MRVRRLRLLFVLAGELASGLATALPLLVLALAGGPVGLGPLEAPLRRALVEAAAPLRLELEGAALRPRAPGGPLELELRSLSLRDPAGAALLEAPRARLSPDLPASLALGRPVVARFTLVGPELRLDRAGREGAALGFETSDLAALLAGPEAAAAALGPPGAAAILAAEDASLVVELGPDRRPLVGRGGRVEIEPAAGRAFLSAELAQAGEPARLALLLARSSDGFALAGELAGLVPATLDPGLPTVRLDRIALAGRLDRTLARLEVERLAVEAQGARLDGRGRLEPRTGAGRLEGTIGGLDRERLLALWPEDRAGEGRRWLARHVAAGRAEGTVVLERPDGGGAVSFRFEGRAEGVRLVELVPGRVVEAPALALALDATGIEARGGLRLDGLALELVELRHGFVARGGAPTRLRLRSRPDAAALARLVPALEGGLSGAAPAELALRIERDGAVAFTLDSDLVGLGVAERAPALRKEPERPGALALSGALRGGRLELAELALSWPGFRAEGRARLSWPELAPERLELDRLRIAGSELALRLERRGSGFEGRLGGALLRLDPWLEPGSEPAPARLPPLALEIAVEELRARGLVLRGLAGRVETDAGGPRAVELTARHGDGAPFRLGLSPETPRPRLVLLSEDAGSLLEAFDPAADLGEGGRLRLEGELAAAPGEPDFRGRLEVREVVLRRAPILARILTLASLGGVLDLLRGRGLRIDRANAELELARGVLLVREGRASGAEIGVTAEGRIVLATGALDLSGTIVPVYTLNRFVGRLPVVGRLLRGEAGVGAFAASWSARGTAAEPEVVVNPLTLVVPGFLRDLAALLAQRAEPAEPGPRD